MHKKNLGVFLFSAPLLLLLAIVDASAGSNDQANVASVGAGARFTCATLVNGSGWCWGKDIKHQLRSDIDKNAKPHTPTRVSGAGLWKSLDASYGSACGIRDDGSWWCWGRVTKSLSPGSRRQSFLALIEQIGDKVDRDWVSVAASDSHACAIKRNGTLWCFGANEALQIGEPNQLYIHMEDNVRSAMMPVALILPSSGGFIPNPVQVGNRTDWKSVAVGIDHTCAIDKDDRLWCWGSNDQGQLGASSEIKPGTPHLVGGKATWRQVTISAKYTCAIKRDSSLWCWGNNERGQLGGGTKDKTSATPIMVKSSKQWLFVDVKLGASCAVAQDNTLWCWGSHLLFPTDNKTRSVDTPIQMASNHPWKTVAVGGEHLCAVKTDGTLWCWGYSALGLGHDDETLQPAHVVFSNIDNINYATRNAAKNEHEVADLDWLKALLRETPQLSQSNIDYPLLWWPAQYGNIEMLTLLLSKGALVDAVDIYQQQTPLMIALNNVKLEAAELLIKHNANVTLYSLDGRNALHYLMGKMWYANRPQKIERFIKMAKQLLANGADVNAISPDYGTPLMVAVSAGSQAMVELLLDNGAKINLQTDVGTAVSMAISQKKPKIKEYLIKQGADITLGVKL